MPTISAFDKKEENHSASGQPPRARRGGGIDVSAEVATLGELMRAGRSPASRLVGGQNESCRARPWPGSRFKCGLAPMFARRARHLQG